MKTLIILLGPTGVGKTEVALSLAEQLSLPIISADSRQIYREIPIGTAAPTAEQLCRVKHYFVGTRSVEDYYSAAKYEDDVLNLLEELFANRDIALMCGGSMMYIDAVCNGIDIIPTIDVGTREKLLHHLEEDGIEVLRYELNRLDPKYYNVVDKKNTRRVVHALEVCLVSGRPYSSFLTGQKKERNFNIIKIGLQREREEMYKRINERVLSMIEYGLIEEAQKVYPLRHFNALNTVGYKELFSYFDGEIDLQEAIRQIQSHTRQYMRKQVTWFSHDTTIRWRNL